MSSPPLNRAILLEQAARLRALAAEARATADKISLRPDREALIRSAEDMEAAARRLEERAGVP